MSGLDLSDCYRCEGVLLPIEDDGRPAVLVPGLAGRPVLMTSMAAALGMLPLAFGVGSGADMLKPLAVAVIGALCISVLLSLIATPTAFSLMVRAGGASGTLEPGNGA